MFHNFSIYDCHLLFKKLVDKRKKTLKFDNIRNTTEEYISVTYGLIKFIDSCPFLSLGLGETVKTLDSDLFNNLKKKFPDKMEYLIKK